MAARKRKASTAPASAVASSGGRRGGRAKEIAADDDASTSPRSRMRIDTFADVADSDDEFHMNREKIALDEGPDAKRRKRWQEEGE